MRCTAATDWLRQCAATYASRDWVSECMVQALSGYVCLPAPTCAGPAVCARLPLRFLLAPPLSPSQWPSEYPFARMRLASRSAAASRAGSRSGGACKLATSARMVTMPPSRCIGAERARERRRYAV